jgi:hypothetical protein
MTLFFAALSKMLTTWTISALAASAFFLEMSFSALMRLVLTALRTALLRTRLRSTFPNFAN